MSEGADIADVADVSSATDAGSSIDALSGAQDVFGLDPSQAIIDPSSFTGGAFDAAAGGFDAVTSLEALNALNAANQGQAFDPSQFQIIPTQGTDAGAGTIPAAGTATPEQITAQLNLSQLQSPTAIPQGPDMGGTPAALPGAPTGAAGFGAAPGDLGGTDIMNQAANNLSPGDVAPDQVINGKPAVPDGGFNPKDIFGSGIGTRDLLGVGLAGGVLGLSAAMQPKLPNPNSITPQLQGNAANLQNRANGNLDTTLQAEVQQMLLNQANSNLNTKPQTDIAGTLAGTGTQNLNALQTGQLPPGAQQAVDSAKQAAAASVRSHFAGLGLSGSSMESQALQGVEQSAATQSFNLASQLSQLGLQQLNSSASIGQNVNQLGFQEGTAAGGLQNSVNALGLNESQLSNQIYQQILAQVLQSDQAFQGAVTNFASALGGAGGRAAA